MTALRDERSDLRVRASSKHGTAKHGIGPWFRSLGRLPNRESIVFTAVYLALGLGLVRISRYFELDAQQTMAAILGSTVLVYLAAQMMAGRLRESRDALRQVKERYEIFVHNSSDCIWRVELREPMDLHLPIEKKIAHFYENGYLAEVNEAFVRTYGLKSAADAIGLSTRTTFPPNRQNRGLLRRFLSEGMKLVDESLEVRTHDQEVLTVRSTALGIVEQGRLVRVWGTQIDITTEQRALRKMEQSERFLANAERVAQTGSWTYTPRTQSFVWSDHLYEMCGVDREAWEPTVENIRKGVHRDDWDRWYRALEASAAKGTIFEEEQQIFRSDGEIRHFYTRAEPELDDSGNVIKLVGVSRDVTRRKRIEMARHELELQVRQLQKLEAIGTLAGGIAHDFNNILGATMGYTDMALMELDQDHPAHGYLGEIEKASLRAKDLVNQILDFNRHIEKERETVPLDGVVREALGLMRASLPANIDIRERLRARDAQVNCDGSQIHQVVVNLCTNASHAMPEGGVLRVDLDHIRCSEPMEMAAGELAPGSYARLSLVDDGHGMDEETVSRIFEPFFTTKAAGEGTGLGLSTVQGIVLDHGGGIAVRSRVGEGTTFEIYLPLDERSAPIETKPKEITPEGHRETILFLDDEVSLMGLGEKMLGRLGYRAMAFNSAGAALDVFKRDPDRFDMVITDLRMPEMSGLEVAQEMRQIKPGLPIVLTTGYSDPKLEEHVADGLVNGTLLKPFNLAAIANCVNQVLEAVGKRVGSEKTSENRARKSAGPRAHRPSPDVH